jgi:hypothetical protein
LTLAGPPLPIAATDSQFFEDIIFELRHWPEATAKKHFATATDARILLGIVPDRRYKLSIAPAGTAARPGQMLAFNDVPIER